jgi:hypothetical protein
MDPKTKQDEATNNDANEETRPVIDDSLKEFISKTSNAAASAQSTRLSKHLDTKIDKKLGAMKEEILAALAERTPAPTEGEDGDENIETKKLQSQLREATAKLEAEHTARKREREAALKKEEETELREALRTSGVSETYLEGAMALLYHSQKRITRDDEGAILFRTNQEWGPEDKPLREAVQEWVNSDEGKHYLPPRPAAGSGNTGGTLNTRKNVKNMTRQERLAAIGNYLGKK